VETNQFGFHLVGQKGIAIMTGPLQQVCVLAGDAQSRMEFMHGALLDIGE